MNGNGRFTARIFRWLDALLKEIFGHDLGKVIGMVLFVGHPAHKLILLLCRELLFGGKRRDFIDALLNRGDVLGQRLETCGIVVDPTRNLTMSESC